MVEKKVVIDTIKKMQGSGIDAPTIKNTLKDTGLSDIQIKQFFKEATGKPLQEQFSEPNQSRHLEPGQEPLEEDLDDDLEQVGLSEKEPNPEHEQIANMVAERVKVHIGDSTKAQELYNTSTQVELNEQKQRIDGVHKSVDALHTKMDLNPSIPPGTISQINAIEKRINSISREMSELKANNNALVSLMKKMIETNREILNALKK